MLKVTGPDNKSPLDLCGPTCPLCVPDQPLIFEDDLVRAWRDPVLGQVPPRVVIALHRHVEFLKSVSPQELVALFKAIQVIGEGDQCVSASINFPRLLISDHCGRRFPGSCHIHVVLEAQTTKIEKKTKEEIKKKVGKKPTRPKKQQKKRGSQPRGGHDGDDSD